MNSKSDTLCLFDVDGTLTKPRQNIDPNIFKFLKEQLLPRVHVGLVGGSDLCKIHEQMGGSSFKLSDFDYIFAENGLVAIKNGKEIARQSIIKYLGEEKLQRVINYSLRYMSDLMLPFKRGTFIECRSGLLNLCPIGRSCTQEERQIFVDYDAKHKVRKTFIQNLEENLPNSGLKFSIGGQISIDVFPVGWDKTYCLRFVEDEFKDKIHFFGDKTEPGGNDYELFSDPRVKGYSVASPEETVEKLRLLFKLD